MDFLFLILGIAGLWLGTELTVGGALAVAKRHQVSEFFVGLVILSIGSDLPELAVAIDAGLKGLTGQDASGVVVGSSLGSVVGQIGFVLGLSGLLTFLTLPRGFVYRHGAVLLGATVALYLMAVDGEVSRIEGLMLITIYLIYIFALFKNGGVPGEAPEPVSGEKIKPWVATILGLLAVIVSSELTVSSVVNIAEALDVSQGVISVLVIGLGTSLPELSISLSAIAKKKTHLSVGNIIGSNILDTLLPIGVAAVISTVMIEAHFISFELPFIFILTSVVLFFFLRKRGLQNFESAIILAFYLSYVVVKLTQI